MVPGVGGRDTTASPARHGTAPHHKDASSLKVSSGKMKKPCSTLPSTSYFPLPEATVFSPALLSQQSGFCGKVWWRLITEIKRNFSQKTLTPAPDWAVHGDLYNESSNNHHPLLQTRKLRHIEVTHSSVEDCGPISPIPDSLLTGKKYNIVSVFWMVLLMRWFLKGGVGCRIKSFKWWGWSRKKMFYF